MVYSLNSLNLKRCWITESNFSWEKNTCLMYSTLEKEMATHSSVLAWRTPGTGEPGGLPSMGSHRVGHDWSDLAAAAAAALYSACMHICVLSHVWFFVTPWTVAHQDPLSMKSSRQEYWSRLPFSFSRESSLPRNQTCVSCFSGIGRWILYWLIHQGSSICKESLQRVCLQCQRHGFGPWVGKIPWRRKMATGSSFLAWESPWTEDSGGRQSMGSQELDTT